MSRYNVESHDPCYRIVVGLNRRASPPTFFAWVRDQHGRASSQSRDQSVESGEQPQSKLILQIGEPADPLTDLQQLVAALAPYGNIPLSVQLLLLRDRDAHQPFPLNVFGEQLAAICQQAPTARLTEMPPTDARSWLLLDEQGWHLHLWDNLPAHEPMATFPHFLFPGQTVRLETVTISQSDHSIRGHVHASGLLHGLPILALLARGGALAGPVAISGTTGGLSAAQVRLVQHEVFFVEESLRLQVSLFWYHAWTSLRGRGWETP